MAATANLKYKVTGINEAGDGRVSVNLTTVAEDGVPNYQSPLSLNLTAEEALKAGYWPGQIFDLALTAAKASA